MQHFVILLSVLEFSKMLFMLRRHHLVIGALCVFVHKVIADNDEFNEDLSMRN